MCFSALKILKAAKGGGKKKKPTCTTLAGRAWTWLAKVKASAPANSRRRWWLLKDVNAGEQPWFTPLRCSGRTGHLAPSWSHGGRPDGLRNLRCEAKAIKDVRLVRAADQVNNHMMSGNSE